MTRPIPPIPSYPPSASGGPVEALTPEQLSEIIHARHRYRKVRRAIGVATFDAWTTAIFATITLGGSVIGFSWSGILLGLGMAVVAYNSFRGMRLLESLKSDGAKLLGRNQLLIGAILLLYAAWNFFLILTGRFDIGITPSMQSQLQQAGYGSVIDLGRLMSYGLYGGVAAFAIIVQPLTSLYYFSRRRTIDEYLHQTAPWVLQMQQSGFKL